ncbi:MAG TPA: DUF4394 domain-containing protein [Planctomycetota bacterium]|nr:DUF4394 domain-containing protein [Planctomycetota bacterium]
MSMPLSLAAFLLPVLAAPAAAQSLLALTTDNRLVPLLPGTTLGIGPATTLTGLQPGESLVGIDFRPANGRLYGVSDRSRLYGIDAASGACFAIGTPFASPLVGTEFGFDFNPTVDRVRVVSDSGQNLRLHPDTGVVAATDGSLAFAAGDPNAGATPTVAASAYTNSFVGATSTTLYGIDAGRDVLVTQAPPNAGTLNTIGSLGRDVTTVAGFDITPSGTAFALLNTAGSTIGTTQLFRIDLSTGASTWQGTIVNPVAGARLRGLAVVPPQPEVEVVVLTDDGRLARFDLTAPWASPGIATISGLQPGESVLGIDFRPATGELYGLGSTSRLYRLDAITGNAIAVGTGFAMPLAGTAFGFDFNPTVDRIRIVSDIEQNLRAHPDTGALAATDGMLAYAYGDPGFGTDPAVTAAAYTNSLAGATSTVLYTIDTARDVLAAQVPPNNGTLNSVGSLGRDVAATSGFDIGGDGRAFAALRDATGSFLVRIDLATGNATTLADLGLATGAAIRGLAVRPAAGVSAFGQATDGCNGPVWLGASGTPFAGSPLFTLVSHNGPAGALGFFFLAVQRLGMPMDFGGIACWLDPMTVVAMPMRTNDAAGTAALPMPLLGAWFGLDLYWQWIGFDACGPLGLATSAGLRTTVQ